MRPREAFLLLALAAGVLGVLAVLLRGAFAAAAVALLLAALLLALAPQWVLPARAWRRFPPDGPAAQAGKARLRAGGAFEWAPPQPPRYPTGGDLVRHRWWDPDGAPRHYASVTIEVPDAAVGKPLARATRKALRAAARAIPKRGRVRASAAVRDVDGPTSVVRARIMVQGVGATGAWAEAASRAFAATLRDELAR